MATHTSACDRRASNPARIRISSDYLAESGTLELVRTLPDGAALTPAVLVAGEASLLATSYRCDAIATIAIRGIPCRSREAGGDHRKLNDKGL